MKYVIGGDIGGTRARFAVFALGDAPRLVYEDVLDSRAHKSFEAVFAAFLRQLPTTKKGAKLPISAASFGIAGPVVDQRVLATNLPWKIDGRATSKAFRIPEVTLLNDLVAVGLGAIASPSKQLAILHLGRPKKTGGTLAVIAAGTGLGEGVFVWDGSEHIACASEGSHVDFAPRTEIEDELLAELRKEHDHVSYERIASGSTIRRLYAFFTGKKRVRESKAALAEVAKAPDPNIAIVELAESGRSEAAMRAIELWSSVYGAEAGNLALKSLSTAGVLVCGGVSARLAPILAHGVAALHHRQSKAASRSAKSPFVEAFLAKGRMRAFLEAVPVAVCLEPRAGLLGAASHASSRL